MAENKDKRTIEIIVNGQQANASLKDMNAAAAVLYSQFKKMAADDPGRARLAADYRVLKDRIEGVKVELTGVSQNAGIMKQALANAFAFAVGGGIEAAIGKVFELGKSIFTTTAKFETYGAVLKNALGSESLAQKAMKDINDMAAKTPFSVDELTNSFIKFVNRGLNPSMKDLGQLADLAASQGKSFEQLTEAVLDAGTGEFERLKEFGIQGKKNGDIVELSFKGVQKTVANTPEAINAAILAFGKLDGVAGSTAAISATLDGQLSNLGDTADQLAVQVGTGLRPVFVAILSTIGTFLGILKELPGFVVENRGLLMALGVAVLTLNGASIAATVSTLGHIAAEKARAIATRAKSAAQWLLNAAMTANPIGLVVAAVALLVGGFITLYEKSEKVRATISGMSEVFKTVFANIAKAAMEQLSGIGDIIEGVANWDLAKIKSGGQKLIDSFKGLGAGAGDAYKTGYDGKLAEEKAAREQKAKEAAAESGKKEGDAAGKARAAAEAKARMEGLKNEEALLKEKLAVVKEGSEREMRLKQQLVTNGANQELQDTKKTEADKRIIRAEALEKRNKLEDDYDEKQANNRKAAREKAQTLEEKRLVEESKAERAHGEMQLNWEEAVSITRNTKRDAEYNKVMFDAKRKVLALEQVAKEEAAKATGTQQEINAKIVAIDEEKEAAIALVKAEARAKQLELQTKANEEDLKIKEEFIGTQLDAIEEDESRKQAAFEVMFAAGLLSNQAYEEAKYEARRAALEKELTLIEGSLGKESKEYKKVRAEMLKNEKDYNKASTENNKKTAQEKREIQLLGLQTAGDVVQTTIDLFFQDEVARKKHHNMYTALAGAKIIMDGLMEVAAIWKYGSEQPLNVATAGVFGMTIAGIQTALAAARTGFALTKLREFSFAQGGRTGGGLNFGSGAGRSEPGTTAVSPMGTLMEMAGMVVAPTAG